MMKCGHYPNIVSYCSFIKMHGLGNDYVYIDCFQPHEASIIASADIPALARRISNRHLGVGSDGLVLILPSKDADAKMRIFNADGSEAKMCGNALRCIGKYLYESSFCHNTTIHLETLAGIKTLLIHTSPNDDVIEVTVNMGTSIGNPHKVFITDQPLEEIAVATLGPKCEHSIQGGTNVEWVNVLNRHEIAMRVWERGSGETLACGTGACAAAMETMNQDLTDSEVTVHLRGGDLLIRRDEQGVIYMTGPATESFWGEFYLD